MIMDFLRSVRWAMVRDYLIFALWAVIGLLAIGGCVRDCSGQPGDDFDFVWGNKQESAVARTLHMARPVLGVAPGGFAQPAGLAADLVFEICDLKCTRSVRGGEHE